MKTWSRPWAACAVASLLIGCETLPGTNEEQGAVAGAAAGAVIGEQMGDSVLSTLLGGLAGAAGGYLIGANWEKIRGNEDLSRAEAQEAIQRAQTDPATVADVQRAETADLNGDGFVTMDELLAMEEAGLSDDEIIDRLDATDQVFELTDAQKRQLADAGLSRNVIARIETVNQDLRQRALSDRSAVIGRRPSS